MITDAEREEMRRADAEIEAEIARRKRDYDRSYYMANKERLTAYKRAHYQANRERYISYSKEYIKNHRETFNANVRKYKAKRRAKGD